MNKTEWDKQVQEQLDDLFKFVKGRDFRFLLPAMTALIEYYYNEENMKPLQPFIREQIRFLSLRLT